MTSAVLAPIVPHEVSVPRGLLEAAARVCSWPAVHALGQSFRGPDAWKHMIYRATPGERATLLKALHPVLLAATSPGRGRLAARHVCAHDDERPLIVGDREAVPLVHHALALLPANVKAFAVRECAFISVHSSRGWTTSAHLAGADARGKVRLIVLGPAADVVTVLHELAHAWHALIGPDAPGQAIGCEGEADLRRLAERDGWATLIAEDEARHEVLADALAACWLLGPTSEARPS